MQKYNPKFKSNLKDRCFAFSLAVIDLAEILPKKRAAWIIEDQLIRAACSIGANLTEARASSSRLEFKKYYEIALKSANETVYWLEILKDSKLVLANLILPLIEEVNEICRMLAAGVIKLKQKNL